MTAVTRMPEPPKPVKKVTREERVAKICATIGHGPGDVALAEYIVGLELRIAALEKQQAAAPDVFADQVPD